MFINSVFTAKMRVKFKNRFILVLNSQKHIEQT